MKLPVIKPLYTFLRYAGFPVVWEVSVGAPVFRLRDDRSREYLLLRYPSGHYDFPKGHIESGETEEETLRREVQEETGLSDLRVYPFRTSIKYFYIARGTEGDRRRREGRGTWIFKRVHYYPAQAGEEEVVLSYEHIGFLWASYDEAMRMVTFENARRVLRESESYLSTHDVENQEKTMETKKHNK